MRPLSLATLLTTTLLLAHSHAATLSVVASADGFVQSSGVLGLSTGDAGTTIRTSMSGGNNVRRGIFEFDLSAVPAGATITSASLLLTTSSLVSNTIPTAPLSLYAFTGNATIETADYDAPATLVASETFDTAGAGPPVGTVLDIAFGDVAPLQAAFTSPGQIAAVRTQTVSFATFNVHALETTNGTATPPTLQIEFSPIPEPSRALLVALALFLASATRRRPVGF